MLRVRTVVTWPTTARTPGYPTPAHALRFLGAMYGCICYIWALEGMNAECKINCLVVKC